MSFATLSHVGLVRKVNQDRHLVRMEDNGTYVILVADGMGGHVAGEVASDLAVSTVWDELKKLSHVKDHKARITSAIEFANSKIYAKASANETYAGMGTTIVAVIADAKTLWVAHVGDSRAYLYHSTQMSRLTEDHSLVNELIRRGQILPEEAETHPQRHMLTRALGTLPDVVIEFHEWQWSSGDILLVCTDGLTTHVSEEEISSVLRSGGVLSEQVDTLVNISLDEGGHDNVTVVVLANEGIERRNQE